MTESTLKIYTRPDDILVIYAEDASDATLADWRDQIIQILDNTHAPVKHLYDFRYVTRLTLNAVRLAARLRKHPNAKYVYAAIFTRDTAVMAVAKATLTAAGGGTFRLFTDEEEAVNWLHKQVPPKESKR